MAIVSEDTPLGFELSPVLRRFSVDMFAAGGVRTIHNDQGAAECEGLPAPVAVGPQVAALIFRMMRSTFREGWIVGGRASLTFRQPVWANSFATAYGVVTGKELAGDDETRLICQVWVEREDGAKAIVGTCSGLVPRSPALPASPSS